MDFFRAMSVFIQVAEARSFHRAAAELGVSAAATSKTVSRLESELGATLMLRTSRSVSLTPEGELFLARCREALDAVQAARDLVTQSQKVAQGEVSIAFPPVLAQLVVPAVARLGARHPRLSFRLSVSDRVVRLVEERVDVAVRMGELPDSSLVARSLRTPRWVTLAAPAYLARSGTPWRPEDLASHNCLAFVTPRGTAQSWWFRASRHALPAPLQPRGTLEVDHAGSLLAAAAAGMGVCQVLDFMIDVSVRDGDLVEVLADHAVDGPPIHALCAPRRQRTPKVRAVLDALDEALGKGTGPARRGSRRAAS